MNLCDYFLNIHFPSETMRSIRTGSGSVIGLCFISISSTVPGRQEFNK